MKRGITFAIVLLALSIGAGMAAATSSVKIYTNAGDELGVGDSPDGLTYGYAGIEGGSLVPTGNALYLEAGPKTGSEYEYSDVMVGLKNTIPLEGDPARPTWHVGHIEFSLAMLVGRTVTAVNMRTYLHNEYKTPHG